MKGPSRLKTGGRDIDRQRPIAFTFDGKRLSGFAGDTVASALLANGIRIVGRSFKYHRPRGVYGAGVEEPNALFDIALDGQTTPNAQGTTTPLVDGMAVRSVNAAPTAERDRNALLDLMARFLPAGFYYKTFIWPNWKLFEPSIRAMAGLGRLGAAPVADKADQIHRKVDLLVVGAGASGLSAALAAAEAGRTVMIVDEGEKPGGALLAQDSNIEGLLGRDWAAKTFANLADMPNVTALSRATAFGIYDHNLVGVLERGAIQEPGWFADRLWYVRARHIILASGAIERPLVFPDNDRPGVMSARAALAYLNRYAVLPGREIVVATNNDSAYPVAQSLARAGARVTVLDARPRPASNLAEELRGAGVALRVGARIDGIIGRRGVEGVSANGATLPADCVAMSGGYTPTVHLHCQARGKLRYDPRLAALVPAEPLKDLVATGAANGAFDLQSGIFEGHAAGGGAMGRAPRVKSLGETFAIEPVWPDVGLKRRAWIDFQNDVTTKDVELAARENYRSIEHLKRYTTLGMATDQGKTSNMNGLALMAALTEKSIQQVGTTTYRPPFTPVSLPALAGLRQGTRLAPLKRLPCEAEHRALGASFGEYGGWLRPRYYGVEADENETILAEVSTSRSHAGIFDASSLGKIEVLGPDAAKLLDFVYYNKVSTLKPGRIRYGFMLRESGVVYDDGVLTRLAEDRFVVSCSSSHTAGVLGLLEEWRQDSFDTKRVFIHDMTAGWGTIAITGPKSKAILSALGLGLDLSDDVFAHMSVAEGRFAARPARIARVSFTGDRSYEISVPASLTPALLQQALKVGAREGARPIGLEAIGLMRAEKGFIIIGKDSDGTSMPHDLGMTGPRERRTDEFVGKRSLFLEAAKDPNRRQLVGLEADGPEPLGTGAHAASFAGAKPRSIGYVTSSFFSPTLGRPIALGLVERGRSRLGETIDIHHLGERRTARIVEPCFLDPAGERLDA